MNGERGGDLLPERLVLYVAREPFLRLDRRDDVVYRPYDGRELRVARGLDSVGGLADEPRLRLREMGKNFAQKVVVLLFLFRLFPLDFSPLRRRRDLCYTLAVDPSIVFL